MTGSEVWDQTTAGTYDASSAAMFAPEVLDPPWTQPDGSTTYGAGRFRYVWPAERDLMAQLAGLELVRAVGRRRRAVTCPAGGGARPRRA